MSTKKTALVVGGTSGLGLELAYRLGGSYDVLITGRKNPQRPGLLFEFLELGSSVEINVNALVKKLPHIDVLVYSAGFREEATIARLKPAEIMRMTNVGLLAPAMLLNKLLKKQGTLEGFIAITSNSQWDPNAGRPVYTATKAALGMLANSVSRDRHIEKVLVAAPAGMNTPSFWEGSEKDFTKMLDPHEVAGQIMVDYTSEFTYKYVKIHRDNQMTMRVEVVETR